MDYIPSLGVKQGLYAKRKRAHAVVVHTTGVGILTKWKNSGKLHKEATPFETAIRVYTRQMTAGPHYIVCGDTGRAIQVCPLDLAAHHVGAAKSGPYWHPGWSKGTATAWWSKRWQGLSSPIDLAGGKLWDGKSCNKSTVGIEVVPALTRPRGAWSPATWATLRTLIDDKCAECAIPKEREFVVSHSDAHPLARSAKGLPWDPSPEQWDFGKLVSVSTPSDK